MNMPSELADLKKIHLHRKHTTSEKRLSVLSQPPEDSGEASTQDVAFKSDLIPITLTDLAFEFSSTGTSVLKNVNMSFPLGRMVAVTGPHQAGKSTFVELLSNIRVPTAGSIFVPGHLRVLHVSREP